jgi:hypothetical protein
VIINKKRKEVTKATAIPSEGFKTLLDLDGWKLDQNKLQAPGVLCVVDVHECYTA